MHIQTWAGERSAGDGLGRAFVASLLLHGLLLWPAIPGPQPAVPAVPLHAILRPAPVAAPAAAAAVAPAPPVRASGKGAVRPSAPPETLTAVVSNATPFDQPAHSSTANPDFGSVSPAQDQRGTEKPLPTALPPGDGADAEGLRGYRIALARETKRFRRYPPQAIDAGWEGTAEVQVMLGTGGVARGVRLARSSGHAVLDEAALGMLGAALPATPVPPALRERDFAVTLPVVFELPR